MTMLSAFIAYFTDLIVPPRPTERVVNALTVTELRALMRPEGLPYQDARVTALIWELKYFGNARAAAIGASLLREQLIELASEDFGVPLLIPVPMHEARKRERGHNHTELLCAALARQAGSGLHYEPRALERTRNTPTQQGLERKARLNNVRGSMQASELVRNRVCIVVDDVSTTGATLTEAKRALREAGARTVHTLSLASS